MSVRCTINEMPVLGTMPVRWSLIRGVDPFVAQFEVTPDVASSIFAEAGGRDVTLVVSVGEANDLKVTQLTALRERHGSTPFTRVVVLADKRWKWPRRYIARAYNVTRRGGDFRLMGNIRIENANPTPLISFAGYSLKDEVSRWTAIEVLADIMEALGVVEYKLPARRPQELPIQNLFIDAPGHTAIEKVLRYLPGLDLFVDSSGTIVFFDQNDGSEIGVINNLGPLVTQSGQVGRVIRQRIRPRHIEVLFTREVEMRFDHIRPKSDNPPTIILLENVLPSPDPEIEIDGVTYAAGTYITFDQAYAAWEGTEGPNAKGPFSEETIRKGIVTGLAYESQMYGLDSQGDPDLVWQRRIRAVLRHWRMTYRIDLEWLDRIAAMRPVKVSVIDKITGQRAPASVYADYLCKPTHRGLYKKVNGTAKRKESGWVVPGWSRYLKEATVAPADFRIISQEAGIIRAYPLRDPFGESDKVMWAGVDASEIPEEAPDSRTAFTKVRMQWAKCTLKEDFGLTAVFSCIQGSPNTEDKLHKVTIEPDEVKGILGKDPGRCFGPPLQIRIDPSIETARFAWSDNYESEIKDVWLGRGGGAHVLDDLLINKEIIEDIAKAAAAAALQQFLDRAEGNLVAPLNGALEIGGTIQSISHAVSGTGVPVTSIAIPPVIQKRDLFAFLPDATRNILLRIAQP